ncbi:MFS transporter [Campylobacter sp. RM9333]|uniref:MFS transporter n=1 Tax=Campylobacter sp. RM9333 TaxID=2735731 RepID=UPI001D56EB25|nr:MFS transporter [Campylobacter sp. RM9333]
MIKTINSLRALLFASLLLFVGNSFLLSSNSILLKNLGYDEFYVGLVSSSIYFGALISTFFSHSLIQKVGHIRSFGFFTSLFAIAAILHIFTKEIYFWAILRFTIGFSYYTLLVIIESWINQKSKNEIRSRMLSIYEIVFYSGFAIGVLLLYFEPDYNNVFIIAVIVILLCSLPLNLLKIKQPILKERRKISIPNIFNVSKLAFISAFIGGFLMNGFFSMSQTYFLALNYNIQDISLLIFTAMLGGFIAQLFIGKFSDTYGRKIAILSCVILAFFASLGLYFLASNKIAIFILCFFLGMGLFCVYALALARASDRAKESSQMLEIGRTLMFAYVSSSVLSPIILGFMISNFGANAYILVYIVLLFFLAIFTLTQPKIDAVNRIEFEQKPSQFVHLGNDE